MREELEMDCHSISIEELCESLDTNLETGLPNIQAAEKNDLHGPNILTPEPTTPEWVKLCGCLLSGPSLPLWLGAVPCFVAYGKGFGINNLYLGASLSSIVTVTGIYSYVQQYKASRLIDSMQSLVKNRVWCLRDGFKQSVLTEDLTLGDIVYVKCGEKVPADIRILESSGLKVDNSSLTGESEPQKRIPEYTHANPLETKNLAFYATRVVEGSGVGMVVNIGDKTIMGRIAGLASPLMYLQSSIGERIDRFLFRLSSVTVCVGTGLCVAAYVKNINWLYPVVVGLGLVPTAMNASINGGISSFFYRLASRNCFVKNLEALETLGTFNVLCTSKTGTLTQGRMTVAHVWLDNKILDTYEDFEGEQPVTENLSWKFLKRAAMLCNSAEFKDGQEGIHAKKRDCIGNATDAAILKVTAATTHDNVMEYREKHKKVCEIAFNPFYRYQLSIHQIEDGSTPGYLIVMKGAPENILKRCSTILVDGTEIPSNEQLAKDIEDAIKECASLGERVIGFCDLFLPENEYPYPYPFDEDEQNWPMEGFRFLGLMSMIDPPRAAVPDAVYKLRSQDIKIIMATGDHPITAKAIARSVGIISEGNETVEDIAERLQISVEEINPRDARAVVIHGNDFRDMSFNEINEILTQQYTEIVFARTSPTQKLIIVEQCHDLGLSVAVTGNDLNDTPALKTADLGIAMGVCGTDSAKNAADMILLDDNFASIPYGVDVAKNMFSTLKKFPFFNPF